MMPEAEGRMRRIRPFIDAARAANVPVIFIQEAIAPSEQGLVALDRRKRAAA